MKQPDYNNNIAVVVKVGDNGAYRDMQIVDYLNAEDWENQSAELSDHMGKVFAVIEIPKASKGFVVNAISLNSQYISNEDKRRVVLDDLLFSAKQIQDWRGEKVCDPVKKSGEFVFKTKDFNGKPRVADLNIVTTGSYTVGSGGDYATFTNAAADTGNLTGNLTFTQNTAITMTAEAYWHDSLGSYALTLTCDTPHNGNPNGGLIISNNHNGNCTRFTCWSAAGGTINVNNLYYKQTLAGAPAYAMFYTQNPQASVELNISDCLMDLNGSSFLSNYAARQYNGNVRPINYSNIVIWDANSGAWYSRHSGATVENLTIYGNGATSFYGWNADNDTHTVRNVAVWGHTHNFYRIGNCTGHNTLSEDLTNQDANWSVGTGNITNTAVGTCVQSTDDTNSAFMDIIQTSSPMLGTGVANTLTRPTCIRGRVVPGPTGTSIGAAEEITPLAPPTFPARLMHSHVQLAGAGGLGVY